MSLVSNKASNLSISASNAAGVMISVQGLKKVYRTGAEQLVLFENLSFTVNQGELLAIVGESGAGKSTLLHILGALDTPTTGEVTVAGVPLGGMNEAQASEMRNRRIGYVWQFHYLLPEFSALENVSMPLLARGVSTKDAHRQAREFLNRVGLASRETHRPGELSGGEQQRVALARALVTRPQLLLADEPTGDLDVRTSEAIFNLLRDLHRGLAATGERLTSLIVTHNLEFAGRCDRVLKLKAGRLQEAAPGTLA
jgi:lipoprotein-releasing system ATP-binding protein